MQGEINSILDNVIVLVKECIAGNRNTKNRLYHSYATKMMTVCLRYTESRQDAEEILQEGFVKVFTCMHQYKFSGSWKDG
jgi:RNA polymerase sigma-70 factor (ECF subfamily)